jgi:hypothetical protein
LAALLSARLLERAGKEPDWSSATARILLVWALAWIAYAAWRDIDVFVEMRNQPAAVLAVAAILALLFDTVGSAIGSRLLRTPAWLLTLGILLTSILHLADNAHLLTGIFSFALPAAFAVQIWINFRFDRDNFEYGKRTRHFLTFWTLGAAVGVELAWWTGEMSAAAAEGFWKLAAWMATGVAMIAAVIKGVQAQRWPFSVESDGYLTIACAPVLVLLGLAVVFSGHYSADWGMPYVPRAQPAGNRLHRRNHRHHLVGQMRQTATRVHASGSVRDQDRVSARFHIAEFHSGARRPSLVRRCLSGTRAVSIGVVPGTAVFCLDLPRDRLDDSRKPRTPARKLVHRFRTAGDCRRQAAAGRRRQCRHGDLDRNVDRRRLAGHCRELFCTAAACGKRGDLAYAQRRDLLEFGL